MKQRKTMVPGLILILVGLWALLNSLGFAWMRMDRLWPLVLVVVGLLSIYGGLTRDPRDPDSVWFGSTATLCGGLFLYFTLGTIMWDDLAWLWPAFVVIAGVSWLIAWLVDWKKVSNAVIGIVALIVGGVGFLFTTGQIAADIGLSIASWWPLILIVIGLGLIAQFLIQRQ